MIQKSYKFRAAQKITLRDFEETFVLALAATESLHGPALVQMDCKYKVDSRERTITIDASNHTSIDLAKIFTGLCERELGFEAVAIERQELEYQNRAEDRSSGKIQERVS